MKRRALSVVILLVVLGLGGLVLALADQNRELSSRYESLRERTQWPHAGYAVPTFRATTLAGDTLTLGESAPGQRQLLFVFDTECPYCLATLPAWKRIASALNDADPDVQVVGVSLDSADLARSYQEEHDLPFPVITFPSRKLQQLYRAGRIPLIVLLDAEGRTLYSRLGQLDVGPAVDSVLAAAGLPEGLSRPLAGGSMNPERQEVQP